MQHPLIRKRKQSEKRRKRFRSFLLGICIATVSGTLLSILVLNLKFTYPNDNPAVMTLTTEDLVTLVDTDCDRECTEVEQILLKGVQERIQTAKKENKRIYIQVGHLDPEIWQDFESLEQMIKYCQGCHSFKDLQVRKSFWHVNNPIFCMGGCGAYLELDSDLGLQGLWVVDFSKGYCYYSTLSFLTFENHSFYSKENPDQLTPFSDKLIKTFSWTRHSAKSLQERYSPENAAAGNRMGPYNLTISQYMNRARQEPPPPTGLQGKINVFEKDIQDSHDDMKKAWHQIIQEAGEINTDSDFYRLATIIRSGTRHYRYGFDRIERIIYRKIIYDPDHTITQPQIEASLYHLGYQLARKNTSIETIVCLRRLQEEFPESAFLPSIQLCKADAYKNLAYNARMVSASATIDYFNLSYSCLQQVLEAETDSGPFIATRMNFSGGGSSLEDDMVGQNTKIVAEELMEGLQRYIEWSKEGGYLPESYKPTSTHSEKI